MNQFSQKTQEELKSYVYALIDPRDSKIFYIGKGQTNRVFSHVNDSIISSRETDKLETIRNIKLANLEVKHFIIRHGLEENEALLLESVLINFLTFRDFAEIANITNISSGHHSFAYGIKTVQECEMLYNCEELNVFDIKHKVVVININKTFGQKKKKNKLEVTYEIPNIYEATRGWWVLNKKRAQNAEYIFAEYKGIIRAIFKPDLWLQDIPNNSERRWGFEGAQIFDNEICQLYLNKYLPKKHGTANPIRYYLC